MTLMPRRNTHFGGPRRPVEPLESRLLLSTNVDPIGGEFRIGGPLVSSAFEQQSVDHDAAGNFVVAWTGLDLPDTPGSRFGILARRYGADGTPRGEPFVVNSVMDNDQWRPSVAVDADGDFIVAWLSNVEGGGQTDVIARMFDKNGAPRGEEFIVNTTTERTQTYPAVAVDAGGNFVVSWLNAADFGFDGAAVLFRRFDAAGAPLGGEVLAGRAAFNSPPALAMEPDGDFILAWHNRDASTTSFSQEIFARRFDASGAALGEMFRVNSLTQWDQQDPQVTVNASGAFAVAWRELPHGGATDRVWVRSFDPDAQPLRVEVAPAGPTNTSLLGYALAMDDRGRFLVTWAGSDPAADADGTAVFARAFDATGAPAPDTLRVNTTTAGSQGKPDVSITPGGDAVVVWQSNPAPEASNGVYGQRYRLADSTPPAAAVVGRHVFYNHSIYDGGLAGGPPFVDDLAIDPTKEALLPGRTASFRNITSYTRGLNGVMIDVANLPGQADFLTTGSFGFEVGVGEGAASGSAAPSPSELFIRRGAGANGSDRIVLIWADGAIRNTWLRVTVPAGEFTGLGQPDVFAFGNLIGETGDDGRASFVGAGDMLAVRRNYAAGPLPVGNPYDIDRDGHVGLLDYLAVRRNLYQSLPPLALSAPPSGARPAESAVAALLADGQLTFV
jgi:hypothetical protein